MDPRAEALRDVLRGSGGTIYSTTYPLRSRPAVLAALRAWRADWAGVTVAGASVVLIFATASPPEMPGRTAVLPGPPGGAVRVLEAALLDGLPVPPRIDLCGRWQALVSAAAGAVPNNDD